MAGVTLDAGPIIELERRGRRARDLTRLLLDEHVDIVISAATVAEVWRGGPRGALVARLLAAAQVHDVDEELARRSGELLAATRSRHTLDAIVVATAEACATTVVTADLDDVGPLAAAAGVDVRPF